MSLARVFTGLWPAQNQRSPSSVRGGRAVESAVVARLGWAGALSFVPLILTALKEAWAADPDLALFDDASITYKGFEHGTFELITKEAVPRHIIVDDPGQTVILSKTGSSVSFAQVANNASRMEDLQSRQQDVLDNYSKDHGPSGSGTPPGEAVDQTLQPIDFHAPDGPNPQHALPGLVVPASFVPDGPLIHSPPTLTPEHRLRVPLAVDEEGAVVCAAEVPVGSVVRIMKTSTASAVSAAKQAANAALDALGGPPAAALFFDCVATRLRMGDEFGLELSSLQERFSEVPLTGCNTHGQIARAEGQFSGFHNCTAVVCVFPE